MTLLDDYEKQYAVLIAEITSQIAQMKLLGTGMGEVKCFSKFLTG